MKRYITSKKLTTDKNIYLGGCEKKKGKKEKKAIKTSTF